MKQSVIDHIQKICSSDLSQSSNMDKAQVMLKNFKVFRCYGVKAGYDGNIPFEALESFLKDLVRKYDVIIGQILAITDIEGGVTWHGGMYYATETERGARKSNWLFTIHSSDLYEYMVKLVLLSFLTIKTSDHVKLRDPEAIRENMRRL